jgi:hypothetical protein
MIGSTRSVRVFAYTLPTDMRKGFDGLYGMVSTLMEREPLSQNHASFIHLYILSKIGVWRVGCRDRPGCSWRGWNLPRVQPRQPRRTG